MGEVFDRYTDTAGNENWCDTETGKHTIPAKPHCFHKFFATETEENKELIDDYIKKLQMREPTEEERESVDEYIQKIQTSNSLKGWICPVCGRGLSPYTSVCPCKGFNPGWKVTC